MATGSEVRCSEEDVVINGDEKPAGADLTLGEVLRRAFFTVFSPSDASSSSTFYQRFRTSLCENAPLVKDASANSGRNLLLWTRRGSRFRALLVISVGTILLLSLTGLLIFMLFFLTATVNAVVISLLMSLAAAGSFLAFFFFCVTTVYIGALSVAAVVISTATISAIIAAIVASGWIGFFWCVWMVAEKSLHILKRSLTISGSAISSYTSTMRSSNYDTPTKLD